MCSRVKRLLHKDSLADGIWDDWIAFPNSPRSVPLLVGSVMHQSGHFWAELTKHMLTLPVWEPSLRASLDEQTPAAVSVTPTCPLTFTTLQTHCLLVGLSRKSPHTDSGELLVTIATSTCRVPGHTRTIQCCNKFITLSCSCPTTAFSCSCAAHQRRTHYDLLIHRILLSNLLSE